MHTLRSIIPLAALAAVTLFAGGCASRTIEAASTKVELRQSKAKGMTIVLPKEMDATKLDLSIDPKSGVITLKADKLVSSSQGVIDRANAAQSEAMLELGKAVNSLLNRVPLPLSSGFPPTADATASPAHQPDFYIVR